MQLLVEVETSLRLARYSPGRIEFEPTPEAPPDLAARLAQRLQGWTGARWGVSVVSTGGAATIAEDRDREADAARGRGAAKPAGAGGDRGLSGREDHAKSARRRPCGQSAAAEALPEVDDEWDPV